MSLRLRPLSSRVLGKLGASRSLEQAASRSWVIGPAVETVSAPARIDDADLARVIACPNGRTIEHNAGLARGGRTVHLETRAYELRDASIAGGHVFAPGLFMPLGDEPAPWVARKPGRRFDSALLTTTPFGVMYFGHWIVECLPLAMLAKQLGEAAVSTITRPSPNQRGYLALLDLHEETVEDASFERLVVVEDIGQNDDKLARYHAMRSAARRTLGQGHRPGAGVFFLRGSSGERRLLVNEDALAEIAARKGLEVIRPQDVPSRRLVEASLDAPLVVGVEGSQLLNGFPWLAPGGTMLALMPPQRFDLILKGPCDALDITFSILVGDARGVCDFHIDPAAFERRLDEHLSQGVRPAPRFDAVAATAQPA
jgi:hypothetical protein